MARHREHLQSAQYRQHGIKTNMCKTLHNACRGLSVALRTRYVYDLLMDSLGFRRRLLMVIPASRSLLDHRNVVQ